MIQQGVTHHFRPVQQPNKGNLTSNHKSARTWSNALKRSVREGQDAGTYLVVDADAAAPWQDVHISPFGCVPRADADPNVEARVIHDLSYPSGNSINSSSDPGILPELQYEHVHQLARRIEELKDRRSFCRVKLKRGDVKSAFRNVHGSSEVCGRFAGALPDERAVVIDLALPFGWMGSPAHYGVFGSAITHLVHNESPASLDPSNTDCEPFYCYTWVDDHVLAEEDRGDRLELCEAALRLAMLAVLGPRSINVKKFTRWSTRLRALGLDWDTELRCVSMPEEKIAKALLRVQAMLQCKSATRTQLCKLLGSLRHASSSLGQDHHI
ncbi:hypothetical protein GN244_ATG08190 [Phytophthora infestans]|uniref:Uncharacterized protein n=1 Tax=Phytophthora infestans TaxID=4787 RepID=A0A833WW18_PHYIN|nr:hypothetical protein GN244_ATG08190 [Phytophthora infestans]